jgi:signal transduction histidine kinase
VMTLRSSASRGFDDRDRRLADEIASRAALAVEHARLHRDVKDQRARLRLIADVSRALAGQIDVEGIARAVARAIDGGLAVSFVQPDGGVTTTACASVDSWAEERLRKLLGLKVSLGPGTAGEEALRTRRPVLLRGGAAARLQPPYGAIASELGVDSIIVAPLHLQGRAIGLISASRGPNGAPFRDDDVSLLAEIADRAAMAFERAQLFEQQQRLTERLRLLADAGTLLAQSLQIEPTLTTFARLAVQWFAHACAAVLFDEGGQIAAQAVAASDPALEARVREVVSGYTPNRGSCAPPVLRSVLASGRPHLMARPDADALRAIATDEAHGAALLGLGLRTLIIVPLVARGSPLGTVVMARVRGDAYDEDDLSLAAELGRRAAMAVDNARLFRQATEAIAVRDEFLSIASHELNTPLTPLKMQLDSLRRGSFGPERTAEKLDAASRQVTRLAKLVSELLDVSRISGGRLQLEPERFDLAALVDEIVARVGDEADRAGSCIGVNAERPCFGSWDRMRIDQVVTNLLTNAIKYGDGKPIAIELAHAGADRVRLVVRDHGIGIPPEHQRRIFERFERAASARHYGGFGLGLWITRQIVEASGGTIAVDSQPGNGAAFVVELPRES